MNEENWNKTAGAVGCTVGLCDDLNYKESIMAKEMTLNINRFLVCSTGEEVEIPEPADSLEAAIKLRDEKQSADRDEQWEIVAEVVA